MIRKSRHSACTFFRKLISPYGFGSKDAFGYRRPTNQALVEDYNRKGYIQGLTNAQMLDHFTGKATYYFWADGRIRTPYALLKIDIDCHKLGTLAAAVAFARYLRDTLFPNLYFETSTNGNGVHGYVLIDKRGFGDERLHGLGTMLDRALKVVLKQWQARNPDLLVEGVEIKGHPPRITWSRDRQMEGLVSGQFAKLPREMLTRFEEFRKTTVLDDRQISRLHLKYKDMPVVSGKVIGEQAGRSHSLTGCVVTQANIDQWGSYLAVARRLVVQPLRTTGREIATAEDMAVLLLILEACTDSMNSDGSMPTARIRENWQILHANGDVDRPWSPRRYTALRDHLSELGYIDWEDRRYVPAALSPTGEGRAARWRASEALMEMMEREKMGMQADVVFVEEALKPVEGELGACFNVITLGEEDLYRDTTPQLPEVDPLPDWIIDLRQYEIIRPVLGLHDLPLKMAV